MTQYIQKSKIFFVNYYHTQKNCRQNDEKTAASRNASIIKKIRVYLAHFS